MPAVFARAQDGLLEGREPTGTRCVHSLRMPFGGDDGVVSKLFRADDAGIAAAVAYGTEYGACGGRYGRRNGRAGSVLMGVDRVEPRVSRRQLCV